MSEPLEYLSRAELQLSIMQNIEREITRLSKNNRMRIWWDNTRNWAKVQTFITSNSKKAGSSSSIQQCLFIGANPDGVSFYQEPKP